MSNDIQELRTKTSMLDIIRNEGIEVKGYGKLFPCPFHTDEHPSANVYSRNNNEYFKCFSCNARGDVFGLVGMLRGLDSLGDQINYLKERI